MVWSWRMKGTFSTIYTQPTFYYCYSCSQINVSSCAKQPIEFTTVIFVANDHQIKNRGGFENAYRLKVAGPEKDKSSNYSKIINRKAYWFIKRNDLQGTD